MVKERRLQRSALDWLRERRDKHGESLISETEFLAGDRLRTDFQRAQMMPRVTMSLSVALPARRRGMSGRRPDIADGALDARHRLRTALASVGPDSADILVSICCLDNKLTDFERYCGWPQRSAKVVLQLALRQLARHYGFVLPEHRAIGEGRIRHWGDVDYRPAIEAGEVLEGDDAD